MIKMLTNLFKRTPKVDERESHRYVATCVSWEGKDGMDRVEYTVTTRAYSHEEAVEIFMDAKPKENTIISVDIMED